MNGRLALAGAAALAAAALVTPVPERERTLARDAAKQLMASTRTLLEAQVQSVGTARAMSACAHEAQEMARASAPQGWTVRRVSLKARNPADRPDAWERRQLLALEAAHRGKPLGADAEVAQVQRVRGRPVLRYLKPITIAGPLCLQCHGPQSSMSAEVRDTLARHYPKDPAHGYAVGDLRGAVSVTLPLAAK